MGEAFVMKDCKIFLGGYDISGDSNAASVEVGVDVHDTTPFGYGGFRRKSPGLENIDMKVDGFFEAGPGTAQDKLLEEFDQADEVLSVFPEGGTPPTLGIGFRGMIGKYTSGGKVGDIYKFSSEFQGFGLSVMQTLMENAERTATGNGTVRNLGQVSATQTLYGFIHIFNVEGTLPTLDVKLQSDNLEAFTTPTDRLSFTQAIEAGAEVKTFTGLIADDWWRVVWTIGGTDTPSFEFAVGIGIR